MEDIIHMDVRQGIATSIYNRVTEPMGKAHIKIADKKTLQTSLTQKGFMDQILTADSTRWLNSNFNKFWTWYNSTYKII